jgi:hypothetical protein
MRVKVILILSIVLLTATSFSYFYSWAGLANNQNVSFGEALDAVTTNVFTAKTTITASTQTMTKTDANTYLNINVNYPSYLAKASNQNVNKEDLFRSFDNSGTMYYQNIVGQVTTGYSTSALACAAGVTAPFNSVVYWYGTLGNGTLLWRYDGGDFIYSNGTTGYYYMNGHSFTSSAGSPSQFTVANYSLCVTPMNVTFNNSKGAAVNSFTSTFNNGGGASNITGFTGVTLATGNTTGSTSNTPIVGSNTLILTNSSSTNMNVISVVDAVTSGAITYTPTSNNTTNVSLALTLTSGNITNGIKITFN